jgi:CRISPR-associated protein Csb1
MDYTKLAHAVAQDAALRRRQILQPVGGKGDKIFPPTYPPSDAMKRAYGDKKAPPQHVFEKRQLNGAAVSCVLIDSVQSQANRLEEALLAAVREKAIALPYVTVDFSDEAELGLADVTSLDAPHRVYDAILRDSDLNGKPFMDSEEGRRLAQAKLQNATALLEISPTALLFGAWHSTGGGGGLGAKFPRCLVSEIIAVDVPAEYGPEDARTGEREVRTAGRRTGSRIDPLGILSGVTIFQSKEDPALWTPYEAKAATKGANKEPIKYSRKGDKSGKPSVINHGNVTPSVQALGVTCDHVQHTAVISFAGLRRLGFGSGEKDAAGRTLLAALGIVALAEQDARGYALRSRCDLVCDGRSPFELVHADGTTERMEVGREAARTLYSAALATAGKAGFKFKPITLKPQDKLVEIIRRSQQLSGGDDEENG